MNVCKTCGVFVLIVLSMGLSITVAAEPAASAPAVRQRVWLTEMDEHDAKVGWGSFGRYGWAGFESHPILVHNLNPTHGLGTHPDCHVEYLLHKHYRTFRGTAAMDDSTVPACEWPIEFRVLGDGKLLWKSRGLHGKSDSQPCMLDITGVDVLRLEVVYRPGGSGAQGNAHAVWIDPYVSTDPPRPEVLACFDPKSFDRVEARAAFSRQVVDLLDKENFNELESLAKRYREKDEYWEGFSALDTLYQQLQTPRGRDDAAWQKHFARLDRWQKAKPDSPTPLIALGYTYISYGWKARGNGFAASVTPEGAKALEERVAKARGYLHQAMKLKTPDPAAYAAMLITELVQDDSREEVMRYFDEGRKIAPRYFPLYNCLSNYLLPKWHGQAGDVEKQAAKLRAEVGGDLGGEIYFRMACYFLHDFGGDGFFRDSDFKYEDLLPGMRVALRDYPENHFIYNVCCYMACLGGDKELAAQLLPRLDAATYSVPLWQGLGRLEYHRQKFDPKSHADDIAQSIASHIGIVTSVACLGDGSVLAGGEWPRLELWDIESGELLSSLSTENQIGKMAVEASGKVMVAAHGQGEYADSTAVVYALRGQGQPQPLAGHSAGVMSVAITRDGSRCATAARDNTARIWDLAGDAKPLVLAHPEWVYDCAFSADGKTLAATSFKGGLWLWDAATGKVKGAPLVGMNQGPWLCRVRFFPKRNSLITASADGTVRCWDLATRKFTQVRPSGQIESLEISPDEKWIALGYSQGRVDILQADNLRTARQFQEHCGAVQGLSFSPDSRTLASSSFDCTIKLWPIWKLEPRPVKQAADRSIRLAAGDARIEGSQLRVEGNHPENLGYWNDAKEYPAWTVEVQQAGDYAAELTYSAAPGQGGRIELAASEAKSAATIVETEGWYDYRPLVLPTLHLKTGALTVTLKALQKKGGAVMNLRSIVLKPLK